MNFLIDEDVAIEMARSLRNAGHEVQLVTEVLGVRTDDVDIWYHAVRTAAILVTCNRQDFLQLAGTAPETGVTIAVVHENHNVGTSCVCCKPPVTTNKEYQFRLVATAARREAC